MSILRLITGLLFIATLLSGCSNSGFPDLKANYSSRLQDATWPEFLPIEVVLSGNNTSNLDRTLGDINILLARASRLQYRAKLLRRPVVQGYERLRLERAATELQP